MTIADGRAGLIQETPPLGPEACGQRGGKGRRSLLDTPATHQHLTDYCPSERFYNSNFYWKNILMFQ